LPQHSAGCAHLPVAFVCLEEGGVLLRLASVTALVLLAVIISGAIWGLATL